MAETTQYGADSGARPPQPSRPPYTGADEGRRRLMERTPGGTSGAAGVRSREALARADRIQIALLAGLFALLAAMLGAGALAYTALSGQLLEFQHSVHEEISGLRSEMHGEIAGLRSEMRGEITGLRTEMRGEITGLRTEMRGEIAGLRTEMQRLTDRVARIETMIGVHHGALPGL